jgi:hypothetical protein
MSRSFVRPIAPHPTRVRAPPPGGARPDDVVQVLRQATCRAGRVLGQVQEVVRVGANIPQGLYRPQCHGQAGHPSFLGKGFPLDMRFS